jgi:hypothetical protein
VRGGRKEAREGERDEIISSHRVIARPTKSLRNGVHHANAVVWEPVTPARASSDDDDDDD